MKKWVWILTLLLMLTVIIAFVFVLKDPPLTIDGVTESSAVGNGLKLVLEIENQGIEKVKIKEILVNGNESRYHVSIGVGNQLVLGDVDSLPNLTFHKVNELAILPKRDILTLLHYGIVLRGDEPVKSVDIKYTYLGFPYTLKVDSDNWLRIK